jgi:hypothetical protein
MRQISNKSELRENMDTLDSYLAMQTEPNHEYAIEQLKTMVAQNCFDENMRYPKAWASAASITVSIQLEKIGTMP